LVNKGNGDKKVKNGQKEEKKVKRNVKFNEDVQMF
jgi:hypothetical protein